MTDGGSEEGGLEELVEFWFSRDFRSATSRSNCSIRWCDCSQATSKAACAAGGMVSHNSFGIGGSVLTPLELPKIPLGGKTRLHLP